MARIRRLLRGASWVCAGLLIVLGVSVVLHDVLVVLRVIAPEGDGPFGLIVGPIIAVIGGVWIGYLRATRSALA